MHIKIWAKCEVTTKPEAMCFSNHLRPSSNMFKSQSMVN